MIALVLGLCFAMFALLCGFLVINSIIVFNTARYMAVAPSMLWRDTDYVRNLPNFLKHLYDAGFVSPWPGRPTALSAWAFRRKLQQVLTGALPDCQRLIQQHLSLWAFVQLHHDELHQVIQKRQMRRARRILADSLDTRVRTTVLAFLNQCKKSAALAAKRCPPPASTVDTLPWFTRLQDFDVLLREHGYRISEEFSKLDRWEGDDDTVFVDELAVSGQGPANPRS